MVDTHGHAVSLPRIVDLDALDEIREALLEGLSAGTVTVLADKVERVSTNALFMLLSAAETATKTKTQFSILGASDAVNAAIDKLGLGAVFAPVLKD